MYREEERRDAFRGDKTSERCFQNVSFISSVHDFFVPAWTGRHCRRGCRRDCQRGWRRTRFRWWSTLGTKCRRSRAPPRTAPLAAVTSFVSCGSAGRGREGSCGHEGSCGREGQPWSRASLAVSFAVHGSACRGREGSRGRELHRAQLRWPRAPPVAVAQAIPATIGNVRERGGAAWASYWTGRQRPWRISQVSGTLPATRKRGKRERHWWDPQKAKLIIWNCIVKLCIERDPFYVKFYVLKTRR